MMQLVVKIACVNSVFVLEQHPFESGMRKTRANRLGIKVPQNKNWMCRDHEMQKQRRHVSEAFDRVHGHSGPWADV